MAAVLRDASCMLTEELTKNYRGKRVLVHGGAGFIGSHLVEALVQAGASVRVLDDLSTGRRENLTPVLDRIELIVGSICNKDTCIAATQGCELVFHQAALVSVPASVANPSLAYQINIDGTSNVFEAARSCGVSRVVYASSSAVYGTATSIPLEESDCGRLMSPYAVSKRCDELIAEFAYSVHGTTSVGLRYFNVYGPRQSPDSPYAAVIPIFFSRLRSGRAPTIFGDGKQTRDFVNVRDVVRANMLAGIAQEISTEVVNVGSGLATTITALAEAICTLFTSQLKPQYVDARPGDIPVSLADTRRAERVLGFRTSIDLLTGLSDLAR